MRVIQFKWRYNTEYYALPPTDIYSLLLICLTLPSKLYMQVDWAGNTHFETYVILKLLLKLIKDSKTFKLQAKLGHSECRNCLDCRVNLQNTTKPVS